MFTDESNSNYALFAQIMRLCFVRTFSMVSEIGIHPGQMHMILLLSKNGGLTQKELSDILLVSAPSTAVTIRRLESARLIERQKDAADQRKSRIFLTKEGQDIAGKVDNVFQQLKQDFYRNFSEEEQNLVRDFFSRIRDNLLESQTDKRCP